VTAHEEGETPRGREFEAAEGTFIGSSRCSTGASFVPRVDCSGTWGLADVQNNATDVSKQKQASRESERNSQA
jgi:hypothetical protein